MPSNQLITNTEDLIKLVQELQGHDYLAIDTEFHREKTYYPEVCLIQLATPDTVAAIDPLAEGLDLQPLITLLNDEKQTKIFHAGRQDLEIFWALTGQVLTPVFDTQIAAMALGYGDQISYINLVERVLGKRLSKAQQLTNWKRRPLSPQQIDYALDDVIYLRHVYTKMLDQLSAKNRLHWLDEEDARLTNPLNFESDPETLTKNIRLKDRSPYAHTALKKFALWRDKVAQKEDRPRHHIIRDDGLIVLAQQRPETPEAALNARMLNHDFVKKYGEDIFAISKDVHATPEHELEKPLKRKRNENSTNTLATRLANLLIAYRSDLENITPRLIGNAAEVEAFINGRPSLLEKGWRYDLVGRDIQQLMAGKTSLWIENGQLRCSPCETASKYSEEASD